MRFDWMSNMLIMGDFLVFWWCMIILGKCKVYVRCVWWFGESYGVLNFDVGIIRTSALFGCGYNV